MTSLPPGGILRRRPDVRFRKIQGEAVVVRQTVGEVLVLNGVGARVLELANGERTLSSVVDVLEREYAATRETITADVERFALELVDAGLIECVEGRERNGTP